MRQFRESGKVNNEPLFLNPAHELDVGGYMIDYAPSGRRVI